MKPVLLFIALLALGACSGDDGTTSVEAGNEATELRDWATSKTSRAELTTAIAEIKMRLRLLEQADPGSAETKEAKAQLAKLEQSLKELGNR